MTAGCLIVDICRDDPHLLISLEYMIEMFTISNRVAELGV